MDSYKIILVKLARPDVNNGARALSKLFGLPDAKGYELIELMPFIVLEASNYAKARKLKNALSIMEKFGFPVLISTETGAISKINWPNGVKINGVPIQKILNTVPDHANLINQCPGCGIEIRYHINLRIENSQYAVDTSGAKEMNVSNEPKKLMKQIIRPSKEVKKEEPLIEELTDLDETDSDQIALPSSMSRGSGALNDEMDGLLGEAEEAEVIEGIPDSGFISLDGSDGDPELLSDLEEVALDDGFLDDDLFEDIGGISSDHLDLQDTAMSIESKFDLDDEMDTEFEGASYKLVVGMLRNRQEKAVMIKILANILQISEAQASRSVNRRGDVLLDNLTFDEVQSYKNVFEEKKLSVKITN